MNTAIVHDWLVSSIGGSEKALQSIHKFFPSPIFTLIQNRDKLKKSYFEPLDIQSSFIQRLPFSKAKYRSYLPLFPLAIEQFDLSAFDLILSSSHCAAKGIVAHPDQLHICYCYTPMRYTWDLMHVYLKESGLDKGLKGWLARAFLHYLRGWDFQSAQRVDCFLAISHFVARRIKKYYGREADVIYPPVDLSFYQPCEKKEDFYLTASRMVPYKRIDLIVEAFANTPHRKLVVIGDGPERKKIEGKAKKNIEFLGRQSDAVLKEYLQKAKGFVFAAVEDFGILPVEAMGCGTPVIAYRKGALTELVEQGRSGLFFDGQTVESLTAALDEFEKMEFDPFSCRRRAEKFSQENFDRQFREFVIDKYSEFKLHGRR